MAGRAAATAVDVAIDRVRSAGYSPTREIREHGVWIDGVKGWGIVCSAAPVDPEELLGRLERRQMVVSKMTHEVYAYLWRSDLEEFVSIIRQGAVGNARLAAGVAKMLAQVDGKADFTTGTGRGRGCRLTIADWSMLLLGWRLAMRYERHGELEPVGIEGTPVGDRYVAHDYNRIRAGEVERELEKEIALHGHPLIQSPMGPGMAIGVYGVSLGTTPVELGEETEEGGRDGRGGGEGEGAKRGRGRRGGRGHYRKAARGVREPASRGRGGAES